MSSFCPQLPLKFRRKGVSNPVLITTSRSIVGQDALDRDITSFDFRASTPPSDDVPSLMDTLSSSPVTSCSSGRSVFASEPPSSPTFDSSLSSCPSSPWEPRISASSARFLNSSFEAKEAAVGGDSTTKPLWSIRRRSSGALEPPFISDLDTSDFEDNDQGIGGDDIAHYNSYRQRARGNEALLDKRPKSEEVVPSLAIESDIASALLSLTREVRFNAKNTAADDWPSDHDPNRGKLPLSSQQSVSTNRNSEPSRSSRISIAFLTHIDQPGASENRDGVQKVLSDQNTDRSDERAAKQLDAVVDSGDELPTKIISSQTPIADSSLPHIDSSDVQAEVHVDICDESPEEIPEPLHQAIEPEAKTSEEDDTCTATDDLPEQLPLSDATIIEVHLDIPLECQLDRNGSGEKTEDVVMPILDNKASEPVFSPMEVDLGDESFPRFPSAFLLPAAPISPSRSRHASCSPTPQHFSSPLSSITSEPGSPVTRQQADCLSSPKLDMMDLEDLAGSSDSEPRKPFGTSRKNQIQENATASSSRLSSPISGFDEAVSSVAAGAKIPTKPRKQQRTKSPSRRCRSASASENEEIVSDVESKLSRTKRRGLEDEEVSSCNSRPTSPSPQRSRSKAQKGGRKRLKKAKGAQDDAGSADEAAQEIRQERSAKVLDDAESSTSHISSATHTTQVDDIISLNFPSREELVGILIQTMTSLRASSLPTSSILRELMREKVKVSSKKERTQWLDAINDVLRSSKMFDCIERVGTDAAGHALESQWYYIPEKDHDKERAMLIQALMPRKRNATKKHAQYYYQPLGKISRWDAEDDM